jgi:hypothetical protein
LKKAASILFLLVLAFHFFGYQICYYWAEQKADRAIERQLDGAQYDQNDLISFKFALHLPYSSDSRQFEPTDGEVEIDGVIYRYVKKRFIADSMELLCIRHTDKSRLQNARDNFFSLVNDFNLASGHQKSTPQKTTLKPFSFECCAGTFTNLCSFNLQTGTIFPVHYSQLLPDGYQDAIIKPPIAFLLNGC